MKVLVNNVRCFRKCLLMLMALSSIQACAQDSIKPHINDLGYPEIRLEDKNATDVVNGHLKAFFKDFSCDDGTLPSINLENMYKGKQYISLSYYLSGYCEANARPFEYSGGLTYDINTGAQVTLDKFVNKAEVQKVIEKKYSQIERSDCQEPEYSGEFYLKDDEVILKEFYSSRLEVVCEFEIAIKK
jgi:hypothetical protein